MIRLYVEPRVKTKSMKLLLNLSVGAGIEMDPNRINEKKISVEGDLRIRFSGSLFSISKDNASSSLLLTHCLMIEDMFSEY